MTTFVPIADTWPPNVVHWPTLIGGAFHGDPAPLQPPNQWSCAFRRTEPVYGDTIQPHDYIVTAEEIYTRRRLATDGKTTIAGFVASYITDERAIYILLLSHPEGAIG